MNLEHTTSAIKMRDTAAILAGINEVAEILDRIGQSVESGNASLFGPSPDVVNSKNGPRPVPSGFLAETLDRLENLKAAALQIDKSAQALRNL
ncbi:MAG: hypothetical protein KIT32_12080 [Rhodocyclaceae bacterium]|nr:hypothetical protein [Rhodocyclaceae bacterium]